MFAALRGRATYANVVATIALILAISGGSAYALKGRNTVFSDDIAPDQVRGADAKEASFRTPRILKISAPSVASQNTDDELQALAECPAGYSVTGGGFSVSDPNVKIKNNQAYTGAVNWDTWIVIGIATAPNQTVKAHAICERGTTLPPT